MADKANSEIARELVAVNVDTDQARTLLEHSIVDALDAKDEAAVTALVDERSKAWGDAIEIVKGQRDEWLRKIDLVTGPKVIDLEAADQFASAVTASKHIIAALTTARDKKAEVEKENNDAKV